ncbi:MAG: hypothetical protein ABJQ34_05205 [Paracoccaceae bacterium]
MTSPKITRMHPDHIGDKMSDAGPVFSKAQVKISATDFDFCDASQDARHGGKGLHLGRGHAPTVPMLWVC